MWCGLVFLEATVRSLKATADATVPAIVARRGHIALRPSSSLRRFLLRSSAAYPAPPRYHLPTTTTSPPVASVALHPPPQDLCFFLFACHCPLQPSTARPATPPQTLSAPSSRPFPSTWRRQLMSTRLSLYPLSLNSSPPFPSPCLTTSPSTPSFPSTHSTAPPPPPSPSTTSSRPSLPPPSHPSSPPFS